METVLDSIRHTISFVNRTHLIWFGAVLTVMVILAVLHRRWKDDDSKIRLWRLLCFVPAAAAAVHYCIYCSGVPMFVEGFLPLYITAAAAVLPALFAKRKHGYRISAGIAGIMALLCGTYLSLASPNYFNHTRESYSESFHSFVEDLDRTYVLKEWKELDLAALESKYMPMVKNAEQEQDPAKFADAVTMFCHELHDGHVGVAAEYNENKYRSVFERHEYGLAMVKLDSGEVIAVCTGEEVRKLGIEDGTVITKWGGKPVLQAAEEDVPDLGLPVKSNEDLVAVTELSAVGGSTVEVAFIDKDGTEKTVTLSDLGEMHTKDEALAALSRRPVIRSDEDLEAFCGENFTTKMLTADCGYLRLTQEETDNALQDILGYYSGDHKWAREMLRQKLRDLRDQGMEKLIIDLRGNMGGYDEIGCALCSLLTDEDWFGQGLGVRKNGQYTCVSEHGIKGDGEFAGLETVALTGYRCVSAGDGTSLYLSKLPNVTLAGITDPNGSNQETGGISVLAEGIVYVRYPIGLIMNGEGEPNIDTRADRISRDPVEVRIPLDYEGAMKIFHDNEDYELDWALEYLENNG